MATNGLLLLLSPVVWPSWASYVVVSDIVRCCMLGNCCQKENGFKSNFKCSSTVYLDLVHGGKKVESSKCSRLIALYVDTFEIDKVIVGCCCCCCCFHINSTLQCSPWSQDRLQ